MRPEQRTCEVSDSFDHGPWIRCTRPARPVWHATEAGEIEEEWLCPEHERLMYHCQECGEHKGTWRGQFCERCNAEFDRYV
jgi:hypothetical protein